jgi:hypothetical protein
MRSLKQQSGLNDTRLTFHYPKVLEREELDLFESSGNQPETDRKLIAQSCTSHRILQAELRSENLAANNSLLLGLGLCRKLFKQMNSNPGSRNG